MTEFNWNVVELERELSDGYVYTVHWTCSAVETVSEEEVYSASSYGSIGLTRSEEELIPFEELTKELVVEWTQEALGEDTVTQIEESLQSQINSKKAPSTAKGLPW